MESSVQMVTVNQDHKVQCKYMISGLCQISTDLAEVPVPLAEDACIACTNLKVNPQQINAVTISKALYVLGNVKSERRQKLLQQLHQLQNIKSGTGTELRKLISWFPVSKKNCRSCRNLESRMNKWGPETCKKKTQYIKKKLKIACQRRNLPYSDKLVSILLERAIHNAMVHRDNNSST